MAIEINNELFLDQEETATLIRNMIHPNLDAIRRRDAFLRDMDDMTFAFSEEGVTAECSDIKICKKKGEGII